MKKLPSAEFDSHPSPLCVSTVYFRKRPAGVLPAGLFLLIEYIKAFRGLFSCENSGAVDTEIFIDVTRKCLP